MVGTFLSVTLITCSWVRQQCKNTGGQHVPVCHFDHLQSGMTAHVVGHDSTCKNTGGQHVHVHHFDHLQLGMTAYVVRHDGTCKNSGGPLTGQPTNDSVVMATSNCQCWLPWWSCSRILSLRNLHPMVVMLQQLVPEEPSSHVVKGPAESLTDI